MRIAMKAEANNCTGKLGSTAGHWSLALDAKQAMLTAMRLQHKGWRHSLEWATSLPDAQRGANKSP